MHLREIDGVYDCVETNESQKVGKYFIIVDRNKRQTAKLVFHEIMKELVYRFRDEADNETEMHFKQFLSLRSQLSQGGYTSEAVALDHNIFDHTTLTKSFSKPTYFDMGMNFGTDKSAAKFPSLHPSANPWKTTQQENQLALLGNSNQLVNERSLVIMNDHSLATTLASFPTKMTSVVTAMISVNEK